MACKRGLPYSCQSIDKISMLTSNTKLFVCSLSLSFCVYVFCGKLDDVMYEIMSAIDSTIDKENNFIYPIKVARYELNEAFVELINSIYPKKE